MKIQPSSNKKVSTRVKQHTSTSNSQFQALFTAQSHPNEPTDVTTNVAETTHTADKQQAKSSPIIAQALDTLEQAMIQLDEGQHLPEQALDAIRDLRQALKNNPENMSPQNSNEADTLLAVETKRLETLNKI
ncbi:MAG: hypothetical protein Q9M19_01960 [Mariprofundaceae bacterium]|nr:hypothetical protein [Mariprofundaceae bacterium]